MDWLELALAVVIVLFVGGEVLSKCDANPPCASVCSKQAAGCYAPYPLATGKDCTCICSPPADAGVRP